MCTAITLSCRDFYFGRTLDLERTYGEEVVISPRNHGISFTECPDLKQHYTMIGIAYVAENYPLFYEAVNEKGLCMAGLNFTGFAQYMKSTAGKDNVACHEFIPWILGQCESVSQAQTLLDRLNITDTPFHPELPTAQLHWIIADRSRCMTVESMSDGIHIHENPVGVLTNNPPFDHHMYHLQNFMHLSPHPPHNHFSPTLDFKPYSRGMGAIGLPGDVSSQSRFIRAAFTKCNSVCEDDSCVSQFFHILESVSQTKGCCRLEDGSLSVTQYTSCCNVSQGIYYYTTYGNRRICAVDLNRENPEGDQLIRYPLELGEDIRFINNKAK